MFYNYLLSPTARLSLSLPLYNEQVNMNTW
jgi:hypothetical protein